MYANEQFAKPRYPFFQGPKKLFFVRIVNKTSLSALSSAKQERMDYY